MARRRAGCCSRPGTRRYNAAVDAAKLILKDEGVASVRIDWRESVRKWHPGQDWVWEPGGFGVCDPGINAMSIFTKIMPFPVFVESAKLKFPANRQTPVDVEIVFKSGEKHQPKLSAGFNWLEESGEIWTIAIETKKGSKLKLEKGGTVLKVTATRPPSPTRPRNTKPSTSASPSCSRRASPKWTARPSASSATRSCSAPARTSKTSTGK